MANVNGKQKPKSLLEDYLTEEQAAQRIGISRITLFRQRTDKKRKRSVPHYRVGGRIFYDEECIREYFQNCKRVA